MPITIKTPEEQEKMRVAGRLAADDPSAAVAAPAYSREAGRAATATLLDRWTDLTATLPALPEPSDSATMDELLSSAKEAALNSMPPPLPAP